MKKAIILLTISAFILTGCSGPAADDESTAGTLDTSAQTETTAVSPEKVPVKIKNYDGTEVTLYVDEDQCSDEYFWYIITDIFTGEPRFADCALLGKYPLSGDFGMVIKSRLYGLDGSVIFDWDECAYHEHSMGDFVIKSKADDSSDAYITDTRTGEKASERRAYFWEKYTNELAVVQYADSFELMNSGLETVKQFDGFSYSSNKFGMIFGGKGEGEDCRICIFDKNYEQIFESKPMANLTYNGDGANRDETIKGMYARVSAFDSKHEEYYSLEPFEKVYETDKIVDYFDGELVVIHDVEAGEATLMTLDGKKLSDAYTHIYAVNGTEKAESFAAFYYGDDTVYRLDRGGKVIGSYTVPGGITTLMPGDGGYTLDVDVTPERNCEEIIKAYLSEDFTKYIPESDK